MFIEQVENRRMMANTQVAQNGDATIVSPVDPAFGMTVAVIIDYEAPGDNFTFYIGDHRGIFFGKTLVITGGVDSDSMSVSWTLAATNKAKTSQVALYLEGGEKSDTLMNNFSGDVANSDLNGIVSMQGGPGTDSYGVGGSASIADFHNGATPELVSFLPRNGGRLLYAGKALSINCVQGGATAEEHNIPGVFLEPVVFVYDDNLGKFTMDGVPWNQAGDWGGNNFQRFANFSNKSIADEVLV